MPTTQENVLTLLQTKYPPSFYALCQSPGVVIFLSVPLFMIPFLFTPPTTQSLS